MVSWLMAGLVLGTAVFAGVIVWAVHSPVPEILRLPVGENTMEYRLWQAELQVQLGLYGGVELVGRPADPETAEVCRLFMRQRPWVRFSPEVCKSSSGVLY